MSSKQKLNSRTEAVLKAVIEKYVKSSEPVGASTLSALKEFNLGPASIRNVMADLESAGFLEQPHTSAGRAPTDKGYQYYVSSLMEPDELPMREAVDILRVMDGAEWSEFTDMLESISKALSSLSSQAGIARLATMGNSPVRKIQFVYINQNTTLAVIVMVNGQLQRYVLRQENKITRNQLERMTNYFNDRFSWLTLAQTRRMLLKELQSEENRVNRELSLAFYLAQFLEDQANQESKNKIYIDGASNLVDEKNMASSYSTFKSMLKTFEEKSKLVALLDECISSEGVNLLIGAETQIDGFDDCTVVAHSFNGRDGMAGALGIVGNKRMNYSHSIALVEYTAKAVSRKLVGNNKIEPKI